MDLKTMMLQAKNDQSGKPGIIKKLIVVSAVLLPLACFGFMYLQSTISQLDHIEQEINEIESFLAKAEKLETEYNNKLVQNAIPVSAAQTNQTQIALLEKIKARNLAISSVSLVTGQDKGTAPGVTYDLAVTGAWPESMAFIRELQAGDIFLNIESLKMETVPKTMQITTSLRYKIFTE